MSKKEDFYHYHLSRTLLITDQKWQNLHNPSLSQQSSNITIPASGSVLVQKDRDQDADSSSTKTEVEEMELDQLSDLEDNLRAHENVRDLYLLFF